MIYLQDIASLITVRSFLVSSVDNLQIKLSREEIKQVQNKITVIDKKIIEEALKLDFSKTVRYLTFSSTEDTEVVLNAAIAAETVKQTPVVEPVPKQTPVVEPVPKQTPVVEPVPTEG